MASLISNYKMVVKRPNKAVPQKLFAKKRKRTFKPKPLIGNTFKINPQGNLREENHSFSFQRAPALGLFHCKIEHHIIRAAIMLVQEKSEYDCFFAFLKRSFPPKLAW